MTQGELQADDTEPLMTRRHLLKRMAQSVAGIAAVGGSAVLLNATARRLVEGYRDGEGREKTERFFEEGLKSWRKLAIFPDLVQIDPTSRVALSLFGDEQLLPRWPSDSFVVAVRPIVVRSTLLRNIADAPQETQDTINRVLPTVPSGLLAFWEPGPGELVYWDSGANAGSMVPLSERNWRRINPDGLYATDVHVDGREMSGDIVYPYIQDLSLKWAPSGWGKAILEDAEEAYGIDSDAYGYERLKQSEYVSNYDPVETRRIIGHCATVATSDALNVLVSRFLGQGAAEPIEPITYPIGPDL